MTENMVYDCTIVGAGASGLMAASAAAGRGKSVLLLEHLQKAAKKLLATGNGKCNFTNSTYDEKSFRGRNPQFAYTVLKRFGWKDAVSFFEGLGVFVKERGGYYYPYSEQASAVRDALINDVSRLGAVIVTGAEPESCRWNDKAGVFEVCVRGGEKYRSRRLVLACGGCASPVHGTDGSGYIFARSFNHHIIKPEPALVPIKLGGRFPGAVQGVRTQASAAIYDEGGTMLSQERGEVLFTAYGISGIPAMQLSRYVPGLEEPVLGLDFFPQLEYEELLSRLSSIRDARGCLSCGSAYGGILNYKLVNAVLGQLSIKADMLCGRLTEDRLRRFAGLLKDMRFDITGTLGFENAQVTAGGVDTSELDPLTMESLKRKGLYIVGELADIDGNCGGYNLQWAWSSGYIAGKSV